MTWRLWVVLLLAAGCLTYRGVAAYQRLASDRLTPSTVGFAAAPDAAGRLTVVAARSNPRSRGLGIAESGLRAGDQIAEIVNANGQDRSIANHTDYGLALHGIRAGEAFSLLVGRAREDGTRQPLRLVVRPQPERRETGEDEVLGLLLSLALPLVSIGTAIVIGLARPDDRNAFRASLLFFAFPTVFGGAWQTFPPWDIRYAALRVQKL